MVQFEFADHNVPYGSGRDRGPLLQGLNALGALGWQVVNLKDTLYHVPGPDGKPVLMDGVRALCQRQKPEAVLAPEALKRMREKQ